MIVRNWKELGYAGPWIGVRKLDIPKGVFKTFFEPATPHRPAWAARRFRKRVRLYQLRELERLPVPKPEEEAWWTCSIKYNFDRWKMDCSATGQGWPGTGAAALPASHRG